MRVKFDTDTKLYFEIGDPLEHACSAYIHNTMYSLVNLNAISLNCLVKKGELEKFCDMVKTFRFAGFDITMPHKSDIISFLDECDEYSKLFNCVNHVKNVNGKLIGIGLDGVGMRMAIESEGIEIKKRSALILGAGSVAGPIAAELCNRGIRDITILNRTIGKAEKLATILKSCFNIEVAYGELSQENLNRYAKKVNMVLQCTSLGMQGYPEDYDSVDFISLLPKGSVVADVLYNPNRTKILNKAELCGYKVINGIGMLLHQQRAAILFHFGLDLPKDFYETAMESLKIAIAMRDFRKLKREG